MFIRSGSYIIIILYSAPVFCNWYYHTVRGAVTVLDNLFDFSYGERLVYGRAVSSICRGPEKHTTMRIIILYIRLYSIYIYIFIVYKLCAYYFTFLFFTIFGWTTYKYGSMITFVRTFFRNIILIPIITVPIIIMLLIIINVRF